MKRRELIWLVFAAVILMACDPYPGKSARMEYALKRADSIYGEGENDTALFIPDLAEASTYFAERKQYGKAALAALYYGYSEKDYDKVVAMESFKEAAHYSELVHDSLTTARAAYQIGKLFYYDGMKQEALSLLGKAEKCFGNHHAEKALLLNAEAGCHILLHEYDKADSCLNQSLVCAQLGNCDEARNKALNNYATLCQLQGAYGKAFDYLRMVEPKNAQQKVLNQLNLGKSFLATGAMDSAAYYFNQMEALLSDTTVKDETKASAYASLSHFMESQNNYKEALEYYKNELQYLFKVKDGIERKNVYRIQQKFDNETVRNELSEKIVARQRAILLMSLIIILSILLLVVSQKRLAKIQKQEMEAKERTLFYVRQYSDLLGRQGQTMQKLAIVMDNKEDKALLDNLRATVFGKKDPWDALVEVFDILHPNERERIRHQFPKLNEMEQKDILLSYFNVSRQDEALLLNTSIHSIDKLRTSVRKKAQEIAKKQ